MVGQNGAGKTTLVRIVAGLLAADAGTIEVGGLSADRERTRYHRLVGLVGAGNSGLYARLKPEHHLDLCARLALMPRRSRAAAIERTIEAFDLAPLCGRRVDRLSMGQRQRLRLALAFLHEPLLALLDEPETSLDEDGRDLLRRALDDLRARGGAAIVCTPSGSDGALGVDRTYVLAAGALREAA